MSNAAAGGAAACSRHAGGVQLGHAGAMQVGRAASTVGEGGAAACRRGGGACRRGMQATCRWGALSPPPSKMHAAVGHAGGMNVGGAASTAAERGAAGCNWHAGTQLGRAGPQNVLDPPKLPPKSSTKFG